MMRKAAPVIDMVTNSGGEDSNLDLIRRMAQSKIKKVPVILNPPIDPGFSPPKHDIFPNPDTDPGFTPKPSVFPELPALTYTPTSDTAMGKGDGPQVQGRVLPYIGQDGTAPDMSKVDPAKVLPFVQRMRTDPNTPIETMTPAPTGNLMLRDIQPTPGGQSVEGLIFDEHGRPLKPHYVDERSAESRAGRYEYISALDTYKPVNHNSRLMSALITGGRGALAGSVYGPGGAAGGFLTGAIGGAVHPVFDEEYAKRRDLAEARDEQGRDFKYRKAESDLLNDETDRIYKGAQAQRALNPQYKPDVITLNNGDIVSVDGGVATPVNGPGGKPLKGKVNATYEWRNDAFTGRAELWERHPGEADKKIVGASDAKRDLIKSAQGWVSPGTALTASATAENRDFNRERQTTQDAQHLIERTEDKTTHTDERTQARRERAAGIVARLEAARKQWIDYDAQAKTQPNYKTHFETLRDKAGADAAGAASELNTGYSDFYEAGVGEGGLAYYKEKPGAAPRLQPPAATATKPGKILPGEDPAIRDYANHFFKGDYQAAVEAIRKQKQQ